MKAVIFSGPTLSHTDITSLCDIICLPPAAQGDVYKSLKYNPRCIGIIDGYFGGAASVWHKEILWAMSQGVHVFGASSMGALRAVELAEFGMVGIGKIFSDYKNGTLEDDDEVALIHGPAELGFPCLSEPMVNIRATLERAMFQKFLSKNIAHSICELAKSKQYQERTWDTLIKAIGNQFEGVINTQKFKDWLENNCVDQKHLDAVAMLKSIRKTMNGNGQKHHPSFTFARTNQWEQAVSQWDNNNGSDDIAPQSILDELRIRPDEFSTACDIAKIKLLARCGSTLLKTEVDNRALANKINNFRRQRNLLNRSALDLWLEQNDLTTIELESLLTEDLRTKDSFNHGAQAFKLQLLDHLKLCGKYYSYSLRAQKKKALLEKIKCINPCSANTGLPNPALLEWYFCQRMDVEIPMNIDAYVYELGLKNRQELYQMLASEFLYLQSQRNNIDTY
jgi:hypothetical protein